MSDDEDVIFKASPIDDYINQVFNIQTKIKEDLPPFTFYNKFTNVLNSIINFSYKIKSFFSYQQYKEITFLNNQIEILLNSGLLLDEDRDFLINLRYEIFENDKNSNHFKIPYYIFILIVFQPYLNKTKITLTMSLLSSLYLIQQSWFLSKNYLRRKQLINLTNNLKQSYGLFKNCLTLILENEIIMKGFTLTTVGTSSNRLVKSTSSLDQQMLPVFRTSFSSTILNMIQILSQGTISLLEHFPLVQIDKMEQYICNIQLDEKFYLEEIIKTDDIKKCYNISLLIVSEYIKRLALCYYPLLWNTSHNNISFYLVYQSMNSIDKAIGKINDNLNLDYKIYNCFGMANDNPFSHTTEQNNKIKKSELFISIHSAKLHSQKILLALAEMEEFVLTNNEFDSEDFLKKAENEFENINKQIFIFQDSIDYGQSFIIKQKNKNIKKQEPLVNPENVSVNTKEDDVDNITIEEEKEDQIFEAICENKSDPLIEDDEFYSMNECDKNIKEDYTFFLKELKRVLISKAEEHIERENKAYNKKYFSTNKNENVAESLKSRLNLQTGCEINEKRPKNKKYKMKTYNNEDVDFESTINSIRFSLPLLDNSFKSIRNDDSCDFEYFSTEENDEN